MVRPARLQRQRLNVISLKSRACTSSILVRPTFYCSSIPSGSCLGDKVYSFLQNKGICLFEQESGGGDNYVKNHKFLNMLEIKFLKSQILIGLSVLVYSEAPGSCHSAFHFKLSSMLCRL